MTFINAVLAHKVEIITGLFLLSEMLALIPAVKANSVFQLITDLLGKAKEAVTPAVAAPAAAPEAPKA